MEMTYYAPGVIPSIITYIERLMVCYMKTHKRVPTDLMMSQDSVDILKYQLQNPENSCDKTAIFDIDNGVCVIGNIVLNILVLSNRKEYIRVV